MKHEAKVGLSLRLRRTSEPVRRRASSVSFLHLVCWFISSPKLGIIRNNKSIIIETAGGGGGVRKLEQDRSF